MSEITTIVDLVYPLEAIVISVIIVFGIFTRRNRRRGELPHSRFTFENSAPFELAYAVGVEIPASPECEITPGLFIYFNESPTARISYQQLNEETNCESISHRYVLRIIQHDAAEVQWLSLERRLELSPQETVNQVRCRIIARASQPTDIRFRFLASGENRMEGSVDMGTHRLSTNFEDFVMDPTLENSEFGLADSHMLSRFIILLEVKSGLCFELKAWDIEIKSVL